ncbi:AMMECR1 domain-containing protein [Scheffersomyces amazonensis]|uniref:AMMECR1 domain-containing protein n=1 Tax=Scheffersomyces amazonensis TaxID=1078765 RepID=UPI00315DF389
MSKALCCYAFETLSNKLFMTPPSAKVSLSKYFQILNESASSLPTSAALFITWNQFGNLRGCIGTFHSQPIESGVKSYSVIAALQDHRFPPIEAREINETMSVSVTLLDNFVPIDSAEGWEIGLHGLKVSFEYEGLHYSGTFLPSVAEEEKWDKVTTLYYLLKKSDYGNVKMDNVLSFYRRGIKQGWLQLTRYDGLKSSLDYDEYAAIRRSIFE